MRVLLSRLSTAQHEGACAFPARKCTETQAKRSTNALCNSGVRHTCGANTLLVTKRRYLLVNTARPVLPYVAKTCASTTPHSDASCNARGLVRTAASYPHRTHRKRSVANLRQSFSVAKCAVNVYTSVGANAHKLLALCPLHINERTIAPLHIHSVDL